jgi:ATP-dependent 26S proteasome regulatory subunit
MSLADDVELEEYVMAKDDLSGADIKAICTEAGLMALRERRMRVNKADFTTAREKVRRLPSVRRKRLMSIVRCCTRRTRVRLRDCICDICTS